MLPYAAYLRVYEPVEVLAGPAGSGEPESPPDPQELVRAEQRRSLDAALRAGTVVGTSPESEDAFRLERDGRVFVSPADTRLRGWLSLARLTDNLSGGARGALTSAAVVRDADEALRSWRQRHPDGAEHVREATWRLPMPWLLVAAPEEGEPYPVGERESRRYRTPMVQARRRMARAHAAARQHFPDSDDVADVADLGRWLEAFHAHSWVELDLAGLGPLVAELDPDEPDRTLADMAESVAALRSGRVADAVDTYARVASWWGMLALREHAN